MGEVLLPWSGVKKVIAQLVVWGGVLGFTAWAGLGLDDMLPPSFEGALLLGGLLLLIFGLGVAAAYRLRSEIEASKDFARSARDGERRKVAIAAHRVVAVVDVVRRSKTVESSGAKSRAMIDLVKSALREYREASKTLLLPEAILHGEVQAELELFFIDPQSVELGQVLGTIRSYVARIIGSTLADDDEREMLVEAFGGEAALREELNSLRQDPPHSTDDP